jgi:hypothetical protein
MSELLGLHWGLYTNFGNETGSHVGLLFWLHWVIPGWLQNKA